MGAGPAEQRQHQNRASLLLLFPFKVDFTCVRFASPCLALPSCLHQDTHYFSSTSTGFRCPLCSSCICAFSFCCVALTRNSRLCYSSSFPRYRARARRALASPSPSTDPLRACEKRPQPNSIDPLAHDTSQRDTTQYNTTRVACLTKPFPYIRESL